MPVLTKQQLTGILANLNNTYNGMKAACLMLLVELKALDDERVKQTFQETYRLDLRKKAVGAAKQPFKDAATKAAELVDSIGNRRDYGRESFFREARFAPAPDLRPRTRKVAGNQFGIEADPDAEERRNAANIQFEILEQTARTRWSLQLARMTPPTIERELREALSRGTEADAAIIRMVETELLSRAPSSDNLGPKSVLAEVKSQFPVPADVLEAEKVIEEIMFVLDGIQHAWNAIFTGDPARLEQSAAEKARMVSEIGAEAYFEYLGDRKKGLREEVDQRVREMLRSGGARNVVQDPINGAVEPIGLAVGEPGKPRPNSIKPLEAPQPQ